MSERPRNPYGPRPRNERYYTPQKKVQTPFERNLIALSKLDGISPERIKANLTRKTEAHFPYATVAEVAQVELDFAKATRAVSRLHLRAIQEMPVATKLRDTRDSLREFIATAPKDPAVINAFFTSKFPLPDTDAS